MSRISHAAILSLSLALLALPAMAQDYYRGASPLEGAYVGVYGGAGFDPDASGVLGGMAGVNFEVSPGIMAGLEAQGGADMSSVRTYWDGLMLARVGGTVSPDAMVYGSAGFGLVNGDTSWAVGAGAEAIVAPQIGVRGDVLGTGDIGKGLDRAKITAGLVWHMK